MRRWLTAVVLAVVAGLASLAAAESVPSPQTGSEAAAAEAEVKAAVLSPRRVPVVLRDAIATARLAQGLDAALGSAGPGGEDQSCLVVRHRGRTLYEQAPTEPLIPASTIKVLTGLAALAELGPDARFSTEAKAASRPEQGVIAGDLWIIGDGDPLLATADYAATFRNQPQVFTDIAVLADGIVAAGVRHITGSVVGDESRYDAQRYVPTWKESYRLDSDIGPASALVVNDGFTVFTGRKIATTSPPQHAAAVLAGLLQARGVTVDGLAAAGPAPVNAVPIADVESPPVSEVVAEMLTESDNLTAELLTKELGAANGGAGTTSAGVRALLDTLDSQGLPVERVTMVDGSGLDRGNRATCRVLLAAIDAAGPDGPVARGFAVANRTGTLAPPRFVNHPAAGRLRAKTGSLQGVTGLTGFVDPPEAGPPPLHFALLANGLPSEASGRALQERVGRVLAAYPDAPDVGDLAP